MIVTIWYPPMYQDPGTQAPLGPSRSHGPLYHPFLSPPDLVLAILNLSGSGCI